MDIDTDHLQNATIPRETLEYELDALDNEFNGRAEYLSHLFGVSIDAFSTYPDKNFQYRLRFIAALVSRVFGVSVIGMRSTRSKKNNSSIFMVNTCPLFLWTPEAHWRQAYKT